MIENVRKVGQNNMVNLDEIHSWGEREKEM